MIFNKITNLKLTKNIIKIYEITRNIKLNCLTLCLTQFINNQLIILFNPFNIWRLNFEQINVFAPHRVLILTSLNLIPILF